MTEPLVTVVIPVYDVEQYLDRCVSSVTGQTYQNLEILLIDDGSPDNCPAMCDAWARRDSRIRVIHKKNAGLGMARNTGIENASGEYISFVDSDDYIAPETLELCCREALSESAEVVVFGLNRLNAKGRLTFTARAKRRVIYQGAEIKSVFVPAMLEYSPDTGQRLGPWMNFWSMLFSMNLIRRAGWRSASERDIISEDTYSLLRLFKDTERVVVLPDALYYYCENENSLTLSYREDRFLRLKDYYHKTLSLCAECGYGDIVRKEIASLFVGYTIAAAKQIVNAPLAFSRRLALLREIVSDELLQKVLKETRFYKRNWQRRLLEYAWRHQFTLFSYLLLGLRSKIRR